MSYILSYRSDTHRVSVSLYSGYAIGTCYRYISMYTAHINIYDIGYPSACLSHKYVLNKISLLLELINFVVYSLIIYLLMWLTRVYGASCSCMCILVLFTISVLHTVLYFDVRLFSV